LNRVLQALQKRIASPGDSGKYERQASKRKKGMSDYVEINLFGSLQKRFKETRKETIQVKLEKTTQIGELFKALQIPKELVQMVMVNHRAVDPDIRINPGDRIALFPKEYPLFVDWLNFRTNV
jgi:molybdopterin converting factor small subunit